MGLPTAMRWEIVVDSVGSRVDLGSRYSDQIQNIYIYIDTFMANDISLKFRL